MKKTVAVMGCGALGSTIARAVAGELSEKYTLLGLAGATPEEPEALAGETGSRAFSSVEEMLEAQPDYVVEAASGDAVRSWGEEILRRGSNLILLSIGALADDDFREALGRAAEEADRKVHLPSGAIGGLDVLRAMSRMNSGLDVRVVNRKSPEGLEGAPGLGGRKLSWEEEEVVFSGTAQEAIHGFPKNVNVAVAAALAGTGPQHTWVEIHSVPGLQENTHYIYAQNGSVRVTLETASLPDPTNPRSSTLAAWSVVSLLRELASPIQF
jgi:aspartate dehydrogenase